MVALKFNVRLKVLLFLLFLIVKSVGHKFAWYDVKQKAGEKNVALTFDDGPHQILTPKLLDELNLLNAKATFYVMGVKVNLHPYIISRMVAEGHEVGNHAWSHPGLCMHVFLNTSLERKL